MSKALKTALWVVGGLIALVALLSALAGPVAKGYVNAHGEQLTGRKVEVAHVGVNLFSGRVRVRGLEMYEDDGIEVFAGFDTLDVSARLLLLPFKTLHIGHLTLAGLHAQVVQEGERFNFTSLVEHFSSDDTTEAQDTTPSEWVLKFHNIRLSHARLDYEDRVAGKSLGVPDVNLRVPGFVIGGDAAGEGGLNIGFDKGGRLNIDADYDSRGRTFGVNVALADFNVENLEPYLADLLVCESLAGRVQARLEARGSVDAVMQSRIGGRVAVEKVDLADGDGSVASFDSLTVEIANINLDSREFTLGEVRLGGLAARYEQWPAYSNIGRLFPPKEGANVTLQTSVAPVEKEKQQPAAEAQKPLRLTVAQVRLTDGKFTYIDHTLPDEFNFPITGIALSADQLSLGGDNNARLRASLPGGGRLALRWNGGLDHWKQHQRVMLSVEGLDMTRLSPWTVAYTGQPIEEGIFGLTTKLHIDNSQLDNQNKIDIYKARVGSRRKDVEPEMRVPLKAALYVLKDKDEKILIDLPVQGNVDSPEFNYMKLVWKTLGNLLVKVATSPARAIGNALGIGGENLEFMGVDAQQHGLTSEQYHTLANLAAVVKANSLLTVVLEQRMPAAENDSVAMRYARLNHQVEAYMREQGVGETQLRITAAQVQSGEQTGYAIGSELKMED